MGEIFCALDSGFVVARGDYCAPKSSQSPDQAPRPAPYLSRPALMPRPAPAPYIPQPQPAPYLSRPVPTPRPAPDSHQPRPHRAPARPVSVSACTQAPLRAGLARPPAPASARVPVHSSARAHAYLHIRHFKVWGELFCAEDSGFVMDLGDYGAPKPSQDPDPLLNAVWTVPALGLDLGDAAVAPRRGRCCVRVYHRPGVGCPPGPTVRPRRLSAEARAVCRGAGCLAGVAVVRRGGGPPPKPALRRSASPPLRRAVPAPVIPQTRHSRYRRIVSGFSALC